MFFLSLLALAKAYNMRLTFTNYGKPQPVLITIKQKDKPDETFEVPSNGLMDRVIQEISTSLPSPLTITAVEKGTNKVVNIKGEAEHNEEFQEPMPSGEMKGVSFTLGSGKTMFYFFIFLF